MPARPDVQVIIAGDTKGLEKSLKKSAGGLAGFKSVALGTFAGNVMSAGLGLAVDGLKSLASFALDGVAAFDELGDATARLDGLAKGLGDTATKADLTKFGVDRNEQAQSAQAIAKTGKALGLTDDELRKVTPSLTELSAQLASLGDGDPVKQAELLAKALGGNAKAAKALGIVLPKGKSGMAAYASIMKQLEPQLDKATSGQASLADVGERWDATLANLQIQLGGMLDKLAPVISMLLDTLMPVFTELVETVGPQVEAFFAGLAEAFGGFVEGGGGQQVADVFRTIMDVLGQLVAFWTENLAPMFAEVGGAILEAIQPLLPKIQELWEALQPALEQLVGFLQDVIVPLLVNVVIPVIGDLIGFLLDVAIAIAEDLGPMLKGLGDLFADVVDFIQPVIDAVKSLIDWIGRIQLPDLSGIPFIGGQSAGAASFGVGATAAGRAGGVTVNVTTAVGDPVAIGRAVSRYLGAWQARGGAV